MLNKWFARAISCFSYFVFSLCPFVPYVNVFFHILACFLTSYVNFVVYIIICVISSCSFSVSLSSGMLSS